MVTIDRATKDYEAAKAALEKIAFSREPDVTSEDKTAARNEIAELIDNFINQQIIEFAERTVQYQNFIKKMEKLIKNIGENKLIEGLQTIQGIVDVAKEEGLDKS